MKPSWTHSKIRCRSLAACALAAVLAACGGSGSPDGNSSPADITVDLAALRPQVRPMTGFLGAIYAYTADWVLDEQAPRILRGDLSRVLVDPRFPVERRWVLADLERMHARGVRRVFMLDTTWGHPVDLDKYPDLVFPDGRRMWLCVWCDASDPNGPPWDPEHGGGFTKWRAHVRRVVGELRDVIDGYNAAHPDAPIDLEREFIIDVWNEPNNNVFWEAGRWNEYYETYCVAENAIREILPDISVTGPSFASFIPDRIQGLLDYCRGEIDPSYVPATTCRSCRVDVLNWHANLQDVDVADIDPNDPPYGFEDVADSVRHAHESWIDNPRYASVGIRELLFLEHTGLADRHRPGEAVRYLQTFEDSGVDGVARTCWQSECFDSSVSGLYEGPTVLDAPDGGVVVQGTWVRRAIAWVYAAYAAGVGTRVEARSTDPNLAVLASRDGLEPGRVQALVGHSRRTGVPGGEPIPVVLRLDDVGAAPALAGARELEAKVLHLPFDCPAEADPSRCGTEPLPQPQETRSRARVADGRATFSLPALALHEALLVLIGPAG